MAMKNLYLNDVSLGQYGIFITSDTVLNAPSFDYVEHQVPGRDGTMLQYNNRLNNVVRKFTCHIPFRNKVNSGITALKKILYSNPGYIKIASDYESGVYQYGYLAQEFNVNPFNMYRTATFDLYFSCQPKKYFNTNTPLAATVSSRNYDLVTRSSLQNIFDQMPPNFVPDEKIFYSIGYAVSFTTITNVSVSWSGGGTFMALVGDVNGLLAYSNTNISESTISVSSAETKLTILMPVKLTGTLTFEYTLNGTTHTETFNCESDVATSSNADAIGVDLSELHLTYIKSVHGVGAFAPNSLYVAAYTGGEFVSDAYITLRNDLFPASMGSKLTEYTGFLGYEIIANINNGDAKMVKSGLPDLPMNDYFEMNGSISFADQIKTLGHGMVIYSGTPKWWAI